MSRQHWKAANLLNPVPCVLISCRDTDGKENIMTAAWCGTVCSDPVMVSVSVKKNRYSHDFIVHSNEFVVNLVSADMVKAADFVGIRSGRNIDKFHLSGDLRLTRMDSEKVAAPSIAESPLCLECVVRETLELGSHDMFVAEVVSVSVDERILDEKGSLQLEKADLIAYSHGEYFALGKKLGKFSYSTHKEEKIKTRESINKEKRASGKKTGSRKQEKRKQGEKDK